MQNVSYYPTYGTVPFPLRKKAWGLGSAMGATQINLATPGTTTASLVSTGLTTAALFDPEPFSKTALLIAAGLSSLLKGVIDGCGPTCTQATQAVNEAEPLLLQNVQNYVSQPIRTAAMQAQALAVFDNYWNQVSALCQRIGGNGGQNCILDRQHGACKWKASKGGWTQGSDGAWHYTPFGAAGSGDACWNWFTGYRDPIAGDPGVVATPASGSGGVITDLFGNAIPAGTLQAVGMSSQDLMLLGMLALGAVVVLSL